MTSAWKAGPDVTPAHLADERKPKTQPTSVGTSSVWEKRALSAAGRRVTGIGFPSVTVMTADRGDLAVWPPNLVRRGHGVAASAHSPSGWPRAPTLCYGIRGGLGRFTSDPAALPDEDGGDDLSLHAVEVKMKAAR